MPSLSRILRPRPFRLALELLEPRDVPTGSPAWAVGAVPGGEPQVWVYDADGQPVTSFLAYESEFTGGVRVAVADLNGDGTFDIITAPGPGGGPRVRVFDGATGAGLADFYAYEETFQGGVWVTAGPIGNGQVGIATGADAGGGPRVRVFDADGKGIQDFFAFATSFTGGVRVALGQAGEAPSVYAASGPRMAPTLRAFDVATGTQAFEQAAGDDSETGGVYVAAGDVSGDGLDDVVTVAGSGTDTDLRVFDGSNGTWANQATVTGAAYGVGVVNWGGQQAVGVLDAAGLSAYTLGDFGAAPTLLGQVGGSAWGGGASVGGRSPSLSPYPRIIASAQSMWYTAMTEDSPNRIQLNETVKQVSDEVYRWELTFSNVSTDPGYTPSLYSNGVSLLELGATGGLAFDDIISFETPAGWSVNEDSYNGDLNGPAVRWQTGTDILWPGVSRTFVFYTPPVAIAWSAGVGADPFAVVGAEGPGKMPGEKPRIIITNADGTEVAANKGLRVAKWQDAFNPTLGADGKENGVDIKGPDADNHDFIDRDPDRFNVWVYDKPAWDAVDETGAPAYPHIQAKISTKNVVGFTMYDDPATPVDLVRVADGAAGKGSGWFWSDSQMLVSNEADDAYRDAKYLATDEAGPGAAGLPKNGYTWKVSDRTHQVALRGTVTGRLEIGLPSRLRSGLPYQHDHHTEALPE